MVVVTHDIAPDGDIYIALKKANSKNNVPDVNLRKYGTEPPAYNRDGSIVDLPVWHSPALKTNRVPISVRVSSQNLTTVSPMFKKMLGGSWKESAPADATSPSDSPTIREISTTGWNPHALVTVLNIIHHRNNQVPRKVSTKFIIDTAVIVDHYESAEAVALAITLWRWRAGSSTPRTYGKESIVFLFFAWVFSWPEMFSSMAHLVMEHGEGLEHMNTRDLPIAVILDKLNKKRGWSLLVVYKRLGNLRGGLLNSRMGCSRQCRYMLFGALDSNKHETNKEFGSWDYRHKGYSIDCVMNLLNSFPSPEWKDPNEKGQAHSGDCSIKSLMQPTLNSTKEEFKKIKITDFQAKKD